MSGGGGTNTLYAKLPPQTPHQSTSSLSGSVAKRKLYVLISKPCNNDCLGILTVIALYDGGNDISCQHLLHSSPHPHERGVIDASRHCAASPLQVEKAVLA